MKLFVSMVAFFAAASAFATPAVGDHSLFNLKIEQNGAAITGSYEVALTDVDATGGFKMQTTLTLEGQEPNISESVIEKKNFLTDAQIADALANCQTYGGTLETYTAPSFTTSTCKLPQTNEQGQQTGEVYVAAVPFGIAKQVEVELSSGRTTTLELQKFSAGK